MIGSGTRQDPRRGKYARSGISSDTKAFSRFGLCLCVLDAEQSVLDEIVADTDSFVLEKPDATALAGYLEARGVPADWLTREMTVDRVVSSLHRVAQAMRSLEWQWKEPFAQRVQKEGGLDAQLSTRARDEAEAITKTSGATLRELISKVQDDGLRRQ
jgi:hypothetical protein